MKLRFTPRATSDLTGIAGYIRAESPQGALRVRAAILESLQILADFRASAAGRQPKASASS